MKILILSCNNGGGHNAVAAALKERFSERGDDCCIVDAMSFLPAGWSKLMSETHSFIYRHCPELYRSGYSHAEEHRQSFQYRHSVSNLMSLGARSLKDCLAGEGFDAALQIVRSRQLVSDMSDALRRFSASVRPERIVATVEECVKQNKAPAALDPKKKSKY